MDFKSEVHSDYLGRMMEVHGSKPIPENRQAIVFGAEVGNIGFAIVERLRMDGFERVSLSHKEKLDAAYEPIYLSTWDTLVVSVGTTIMNWIGQLADVDLRLVLDDCLVAPIRLVNRFVEMTIDHEHKKHIVLIGSMAYRNVLNASSVYCAAKAGLAHFGRCAAWELTPKGYDVFVVHPSNTEGTPMTEETIKQIMKYRGLDRKAAERYWGSINLKDHWLRTDEIAEVVSWLVSGRACHASGAQIELAGGQR
jgi:NAD(P)-dependent dehydrogenase (short-subunit alcohol dehydrogenase family)